VKFAVEHVGSISPVEPGIMDLKLPHSLNVTERPASWSANAYISTALLEITAEIGVMIGGARPPGSVRPAG